MPNDLAQFPLSELFATKLRDGLYAVRPEGALGTHGWKGGKPFTVWFTKRVPAGITKET